jgi:hypothetical protein
MVRACSTYYSVLEKRREKKGVKTCGKPDTVVHAYNPSTQKAEAGGRILGSRPAWVTKKKTLRQTNKKHLASHSFLELPE